MVTKQAIIEWQEKAPWTGLLQVEQDLIISRTLITLFSDAYLKRRLAFRGGTAIHKLFLTPAARYSEDIDLVQVVTEPIGGVIDRIRDVLDFLGKPTVKQKKSNNTMIFKTESVGTPGYFIKIKIEINSQEHTHILDLLCLHYEMTNSWFSGNCTMSTYEFNELVGTKMRALYQRRKGRDLFDLYKASFHPLFDIHAVIDCFNQYMAFSGNPVPSQKEFLVNLEEKMKNRLFLGDTVI